MCRESKLRAVASREAHPSASGRALRGFYDDRLGRLVLAAAVGGEAREDDLLERVGREYRARPGLVEVDPSLLERLTLQHGLEDVGRYPVVALRHLQLPWRRRPALPEDAEPDDVEVDLVGRRHALIEGDVADPRARRPRSSPPALPADLVPRARPPRQAGSS